MATISLCMIVKNEEKVLARCLESIKNAVDEIIIADTGSTDSTKEIAKKYTDKIFDFKWVDDFSKARNFSFSKAEKDYIMWLDADDIISKENCEKLIQLKKNLENEDVVMMKYSTAFDENGNSTFSYYRERLIKKSFNPIWKGRVHEAIEPGGSIVYSDIEIEHHSVKTEYSRRNLNIYEQQIKDGEPLLPRDLFYYGRELYYHNKYDKAIKTLSDFIQNKNGWVENKIEACRILSYCYRSIGELDHALFALFNSFSYDLPRAETCCEAGSLFMLKSQYNQAIYWFKLALELPNNEQNGGFNNMDAQGYLPCIQLCVCYDKLGNHTEAEKYNNMAGEYRPSSAAYLQNVEYFNSLHQRGVF
ncbi:MAG: glycosyltransferase family 2 protein [Eubacterium sp.]|nr:glycosyltransferase family 2 protein [Eubacterium sp.]